MPGGGLISLVQNQCTSHRFYFFQVTHWQVTVNRHDVYITHGVASGALCHTSLNIDKNTDQSLILLATIDCLLGAIQWINKMPINVSRPRQCINTSDSICDPFKLMCDRNHRNDRGTGKSCLREKNRGVQISCYSCYLCHIQTRGKNSTKSLLKGVVTSL